MIPKPENPKKKRRKITKKRRSKIDTPTKKEKMDACDELWSLIIKGRAGNVSELSGKGGALHAHHLFGKSSLRLRYDLDNGIACTQGEHKFGFHHASRAADYMDKAAKIRDFEAIRALKRFKCTTDLDGIWIWLAALYWTMRDDAQITRKPGRRMSPRMRARLEKLRGLRVAVPQEWRHTANNTIESENRSNAE